MMATDGWDVDGAVAVRFKTRVQGRPYTIQEQVEELEEQRYEGAVEAAEAFATRAGELAELALSREPTVEAWRPPDPAEGRATAPGSTPTCRFRSVTRNRFRLFATVIVAAIAGATLSVAGASSHSTASLPAVKHVFVIVLENENGRRRPSARRRRRRTSRRRSSGARRLRPELLRDRPRLARQLHRDDLRPGAEPGDAGRLPDLLATSSRPGRSTATASCPGSGCVYPARSRRSPDQLEAAG